MCKLEIVKGNQSPLLNQTAKIMIVLIHPDTKKPALMVSVYRDRPSR